MEFSNL